MEWRARGDSCGKASWVSGSSQEWPANAFPATQTHAGVLAKVIGPPV
jgi:hypothetical protein